MAAGEPWKEYYVETIETTATSFIEVKLTRPPESDTLFIGLSKGWIANGNKRYKSNVTFSEDIAEKIVKAIKKCQEKAEEVKKS